MKSCLWTISAGLLAGTLLLAGCTAGQATPPAANVDITMDVDPAPPTMGNGLLLVTLQDRVNGPVDDATVEVEGNMTHPGMSPTFSTVKGGRGGLYRVPFSWSMAGDWVLTVKATLPDGSEVQKDFPYSVTAQ